MSIVVGDLVKELPKSNLPAGSAVDGGEFIFFVSGPKPLSCDVAIRDGEALVLSTGGNAAVHIGRKQFSYSTDCWALEPITSKVSGEFLHQYISFKINHIDTFGFEGSGLRHLKKEFIRKYPVPEFTKPEQTKIAEVLSTVDRAIEQTEALIAKQQRIKTGLMQDLLTRGIDEHGNLRSEQTHEFKDSSLGRIPVEWKIKSLDQLTSRIVDGVHRTPTYVESGIPFIVITDLTGGSDINFSNTRFVSEKNHREFSKRADPKSGDVLVTKDGTLGVARIVPPDSPEFSIFVSVAMLRPKQNVCLPELIWVFFESGTFLVQLGALSAGTGLAHIHLEHFRSFLLRCPPIDEQQQIFRTINKQQDLLNSAMSGLHKLKKQKTALMQDLLTGKKRVTPLLNDTEVVHG